MAVLVFHARSFFFLRLKDVSPSIQPEEYSKQIGVLGRAFFFVTSFGHEAVMVFFVLSGFFITRSIRRAHVNNTWSASSYSLARLSRLWVALIPALILTVFWDVIGNHFFENTHVYHGDIYGLIKSPPIDDITLSNFFGCWFFLQGIFTGTLGSNGALWSLANEFWYYVIFPVFYFAVVSRVEPYRRVILAFTGTAVVLLLLAYGSPTIVGYFPIWLMGAAVVLIHENQSAARLLSLKSAFIASVILMAVVLTFIRVTNLSNIFLCDYIIGLSSMFLVACLPYHTPHLIVSRAAKSLSEISYTAYLAHMPIAAFLCAMFAPFQRHFDGGNFMTFTMVVLVILCYVYICWYFFERNTDKVRQAFLQGFAVKSIS